MLKESGIGFKSSSDEYGANAPENERISFSGFFVPKMQRYPARERNGLGPVTPGRQGENGRSLLNRYEKLSLSWAGHDSRPVPLPAGRGLLFTPSVHLSGTDLRTLAGSPHLAQGRASAAGTCFPLPCRGVRGDHTKLLFQQRRFLYIGLPRSINPLRPNTFSPIDVDRDRWI